MIERLIRICGGAPVNALYALRNAQTEKDLICRVVNMRGDVDTVLALAFMLRRLFFPASKEEVQFAYDINEMKNFVYSSTPSPGQVADIITFEF